MKMYFVTQSTDSGTNFVHWVLNKLRNVEVDTLVHKLQMDNEPDKVYTSQTLTF